MFAESITNNDTKNKYYETFTRREYRSSKD